VVLRLVPKRSGHLARGAYRGAFAPAAVAQCGSQQSGALQGQDAEAVHHAYGHAATVFATAKPSLSVPMVRTNIERFISGEASQNAITSAYGHAHE